MGAQKSSQSSSTLGTSEKSLRTPTHIPSNATDHYHDMNEFSNDKVGHLVKQILLGKNIELAHMLNGANHSLMNGTGDDIESSIHPLFGGTTEGHGTCKWPSCEMAFDDLQSFMR